MASSLRWEDYWTDEARYCPKCGRRSVCWGVSISAEGPPPLELLVTRTWRCLDGHDLEEVMR